MSTAAHTVPISRPPRPLLRPLVLPTEHGGWGFLFEPLVLGLAVRPSLGGLLIALAFIGGFLTRQPLKLAVQDAMRGKSYPRTRWCWGFAAGYAFTGLAALALAIAVSGWDVFIPIGLVAPLGLLQIFYDASNKSRALLPELGGAAAMASSAAAIGMAGGMRLVPALTLSAIVIARGIPAIILVRTLITRSRGLASSGAPAIALHLAAAAFTIAIGAKLATVAMALLFIRATWTLFRPAPPARTIGWREIAWGVVTIALVASGYYWRL